MLRLVPPEPVTAYTDGACVPNPGPGGWAWAVPEGPFAAGADPDTTNNRMELIAVVEAIAANPHPVHVITDSVYVKSGIETWRHAWQANGWRTKARSDVKNRDLWERLCAAVDAGEVTFGWVKGHSGDPMNDLVDRLAAQACATQEPRSGEAPPDPATHGPPDLPGATVVASVAGRPSVAAAVADPRVPAGHRLAAFGHRPPELGGYGRNPVSDSVRRRLREILAAKAQLHPDLVVLTGLQLGAETLAAEAAADAGVPYVAVLPYPDPDKVWSADARRRFAELVSAASAVVTLERKVPADKAAAGKALARRDGWLAANADEALLVWDGAHASLRDLHRKLEQRLGDDLWVVEPS